MITTGCLLQGDRLALERSNSGRAHGPDNAITTKIHTMDANYAAQTQA
jgi:hypothetical protein